MSQAIVRLALRQIGYARARIAEGDVMADGYQTESIDVASAFVALELTKQVMASYATGSLDEYLARIDKAYRAVHATVRVAYNEG
jgi:CRP-like cAMP-binding protein